MTPEEAARKAAEEAQKNLEIIGNIAGALEDGFRDLGSRLLDIVDDIREGADNMSLFESIVRDTNRSLRSLSKINETLIKNQTELNERTLTVKKVQDQINKVLATREVLSSRLENLQRSIADAGVATVAQETEIASLTHKISEVSEEVLQNFYGQKEAAEQLEIQLQRINASLGIAGASLKGAENILNKLGLGVLSNVINFKQINNQLQQQAAILTNNGQQVAGLGTKLQLAGKAASLFKNQMITAMADPTISAMALFAIFKKWVELGFRFDKEITSMSKSMAVSKDVATILRDRYVEIEATQESIFETTANLVKGQLELADAFGATRGFTDQQVKDQVKLTEQIGLEKNEAAGIQQLALANFKTVSSIENSIIKQTASLARQTGIQFNNKKILAEVAQISGQLRLQYQNNPDLIAKAVVQTDRLGVSLEQAAKSSKHLLNFEESISDQISAELLTGKQLNLERARLLALNGDVAGSMQEMLSQVGTASEFAQMNVIQQEAIAKAVGMTADELANSLVQQENLNKLGYETKKQIQEQADALKAQGKIEEANQLLASVGNEEQAKAALDRIDAQTQFQKAIEKLQSTLANIVNGPMGKMLDILVTFISKADVLKAILAAIGTIMIGTAAAWAFMNPLMAGLGAAAAATVYGVAKLSDGEIDKNGLIVGKYSAGTIQPIAQGRADDNVIFTTNKPSQSNNDALIREQQRTNDLLIKLYNKEGVIHYDSDRAGKSANVNSYMIQ